jgi:hypothetical protein
METSNLSSILIDLGLSNEDATQLATTLLGKGPAWMLSIVAYDDVTLLEKDIIKQCNTNKMYFRIALEGIKKFMVRNNKQQQQQEIIPSSIGVAKKSNMPLTLPPLESRPLQEIPAVIEYNSCFTLSPDGKRLYFNYNNDIEIMEFASVNNNDDTLRIQPSITGKLTGAHTHRPGSIAVSNSGKLVASGSYYLFITDAHCGEDFNDCELIVWDADNLQTVLVFQKEEFSRTISLQFDEQDRFLASGHWRGEVIVFDTKTWSILRTFDTGEVPIVAFMPKNSSLSKKVSLALNVSSNDDDTSCYLVVGDSVGRLNMVDVLKEKSEFIQISTRPKGHWSLYWTAGLVCSPTWGVITSSNTGNFIELWDDVQLPVPTTRVSQVKASTLALVHDNFLLSVIDSDRANQVKTTIPEGIVVWSLPKLEKLDYLNINVNNISMHVDNNNNLVTLMIVSNHKLLFWGEDENVKVEKFLV